MGRVGRNDKKDIAEIRDFVLSAEKDYLKELLENEENLNKIQDYMNMPLSTVLKVCKSIINAMELGVIKTQKDEIKIIDDKTSAKLEKQLVLMMASIDDVQMAQILELTKDNNINLEV